MSIKYSDYVKRPFDECEYSQEQISELAFCVDYIKPFLKHVKIIHPDRGKITFEPYDFQNTILNTVKDERFIVILCSRQSGKCLSYDTTVSVRNKKTGEIRDVSVGDLFTENKV